MSVVFTGSFAASIHNGKKPANALIYPSAASAIPVTRLGAQTSIPTRNEIVNFIRASGFNSMYQSSQNQRRFKGK